VRETVCTEDFGSNRSDIQRRLGCGGWLALCRPSTGCVVRRAASPHAARCAHAVLADYNLNIYITSHYVLAGPSGPGGGRGAGSAPWAVGRGTWSHLGSLHSHLCPSHFVIYIVLASAHWHGFWILLRGLGHLSPRPVRVWPSALPRAQGPARRRSRAVGSPSFTAAAVELLLHLVA
jgi:hypothetical protein